MSARPAHAFRPSVSALRRVRAILLGLTLLCMSVQRAVAGDSAVGVGAWLAEEVRGTVLVRTAGQGAAAWQQLQAASPIAGQSEIATGSDGTALLNNGVDHIRLSPNSRLVLPPDQNRGLLTIIEQSLGSIFFDIGHRPERSFEVDSPYLVVLVKGTRFTVNANYLGDSVSVTNGTVEVRTRGGGNAPGTLIAAGQTASIRAGGGSISLGSAGGPAGAGSGPGKGGSEPNLPQLRNANPPHDGGGGEEGGGTGGEQSGGGGSGGSGSGSGSGSGGVGGSGSGAGGGDPGDGAGDPDPGGGDPDPGDGGAAGGGQGCGSGHDHDHHHSHRERGA